MVFREGQNLELKQSLSDMQSILQSVVAFANSKGGKVLVGISDNGKVVGVDIGKNTLENLARDIVRSIAPPFAPVIEVESFEGKNVLVILVEESATKPHFYKNIGYVRSGTSNLKIDPQGVERLLKERISFSFESQQSKATMRDVDLDVFEVFKSRAKKYNRIPLEHENDEELLSKLGVFEKGKLTNAGVLLFAKQPSLFIPHFSFNCAVSNVEKFELTELKDIKRFEMPFFSLVEAVVNFSSFYLPKRVELLGIARIEEPFIGSSALREVIVNSLIHRDYAAPTPNYLLITPLMLLVSNPGESKVETSKLYGFHQSKLRNSTLARVAYYAGYCDEWGSGTTNVALECKKAFTIPSFENRDGGFEVRIPFKIDETTLQILSELKNPLSSQELSKRLGIASRTARKLLLELVGKRVIEKIQIGKNVKYKF